MPFYEYQCGSCGHHVEVLQKVSDSPLKKCPDCGKSAMKRLMSAPVFRLKGSGWYETDFKSDQENKRNLAGREESAESSSETKADSTSKTEAKSDPAKSEAKKTVVAKPAAAKPAKPAAKKKATVKPAAKKKARR